MARTKRTDWQVPRGYQSSDDLQFTFWKTCDKSNLDSRAVKVDLGHGRRDAETGLLRARGEAEDQFVDEGKMGSGRIRG